MHRSQRIALAGTMVMALVAPTFAQQQPDPNSPRYKGVVALEAFLQTQGDEAIDEFIGSRIAASVREAMGDERLAETLAAIRGEIGGAELRGGRPMGPLSAEVVFDGSGGSELVIAFELDEQDNDRFTMIRSPRHSIG